MNAAKRTPKKRDELFEFWFRIGMIWKIILGFAHLIVGLSLIRLVGTPLVDVFYKILGEELIEDPGDFLIHVVQPLLQHFSLTVTYFLALYFILWGIIDIVLPITLLQHRMYAFPIGIGLTGLFILYEIYRYFNTYSVILLFVIGIDIFVMWLIWREYKTLLKRHGLETVNP